MNGLLILCVLIYLIGAGWQDLRTRQILNGWSAAWGGLFVTLHLWQGTWVAALIGLLVMGFGTLLPTIRGWWGVGDFKMAMVLGVAVGALPAAVLWWVGCLAARWLEPWLRRQSRRYMNAAMAQTIPLATVMGIVAVVLVCVGTGVRMVMVQQIW